MKDRQKNQKARAPLSRSTASEGGSSIHLSDATPTHADAFDQWVGLEALEQRLLLSVSLGADGFHDFGASSDTRIIYVSNSEGSDENSGLSEDAPVRSIDKAKELARNGSPDWVLFKSGDVWNDGLGGWELSGRSADEMMLVSSYGEGERPLFRRGMDNITGYAEHVAFVGLHFDAEWRKDAPADKMTGVRWLGGANNLLFEDMHVENFKDGFVFQELTGQQEDITVRRSVIADNFASDTSHSQGLFALGVEDLLIEENVFDHNGWLTEEVPEAVATKFNHNIYIQHGTIDTVVRGNIIARGSAHGIQMRNGGVADNNLFVGNSIAMLMSTDVKADRSDVQPNFYQVTNNVAVESAMRELSDGASRGWGYQVYGQFDEVIGDNLAAHTPDGRNAWDGAKRNNPDAVKYYNWGRADDSGTFSDPTRSVDTYHAELGRSASLEAFLDEARRQSRDAWNPAYTADAVNSYIRAGFDMGPEPSLDPQPAPEPSPQPDPTPQPEPQPDPDPTPDPTPDPDPNPTPDDGVLPEVSWTELPETYQIGSDASLKLDVSGELPAGADVLFLVWSDSEFRMVHEAAQTLTEGPWELDNAKLDQIPEGRAQFQAILRQDNAHQVKVTKMVDIAPPAPVDTTAPTATLTAIDDSEVNHRLHVRYADDAQVDAGTLDGSDLSVILPDGSTAEPELLSTTTGADGAIEAVYRILAPGGEWDYADNGTYQVRLNEGAIADVNGNAVAAAALGDFDVLIPAPQIELDVAPAVTALTPGGSTMAMLALSNTGQTSFEGLADIELFLSEDAAFDQSDVRVGNVQSVVDNLATGQTLWTGGAIHTPASLADGTYRLLAVMDTGRWPGAYEADRLVGVSDDSINVQTPGMFFGQVDGENRSLNVLLPDGNNVRFELDGPGVGEIVSNGDDGFSLKLTGVDADSVVNVTGAEDVRFADVQVDGDLGAFLATGGDLAGRFDVAGSLGELRLDDTSAGATIQVHGDAGTLRFDRADDLNLTIAGEVDRLTAVSWKDTDGAADRLTADGLDKLRVYSGMDASLDLGSLGEAVLGETVTAGQWRVEGDAGRIELRDGAGEDWTVTIGGQLDELFGREGVIDGRIEASTFRIVRSDDGFAADLAAGGQLDDGVSIHRLLLRNVVEANVTAAGNVHHIEAGAWDGGAIKASSITNFNASGDVNVDVDVSGVDGRSYSLGWLNLDGGISGGDWRVDGDVQRFRAAHIDQGWSASLRGHVHDMKVGQTFSGRLMGDTFGDLEFGRMDRAFLYAEADEDTDAIDNLIVEGEARDSILLIEGDVNKARFDGLDRTRIDVLGDLGRLYVRGGEAEQGVSQVYADRIFEAWLGSDRHGQAAPVELTATQLDSLRVYDGQRTRWYGGVHEDRQLDDVSVRIV